MQTSDSDLSQIIFFQGQRTTLKEVLVDYLYSCKQGVWVSPDELLILRHFGLDTVPENWRMVSESEYLHRSGKRICSIPDDLY